MLKHKITLLALITGLLIAPAAADLEFRDPDNVSFYTGLEFNGDNQIYGLAEPTASSSPVRLQDVESGFYNLSGDTLEGDIDFDGYNAELGGGYISNDGDSEGVAIDNTGNVDITGELDLQESPVSNIGLPQDNRDAVRQGQLSNYYNISGDTLDGNLDLGGNEIQDSSGQITLGAGKVNIPDGNLNLNGNNLTSTGNQEICAGDMC